VVRTTEEDKGSDCSSVPPGILGPIVHQGPLCSLIRAFIVIDALDKLSVRYGAGWGFTHQDPPPFLATNFGLGPFRGMGRAGENGVKKASPSPRELCGAGNLARGPAVSGP